MSALFLPPSLAWYWNRLRCMSPAELSHRVQQKVAARLERLGIGAARAVPAANLSRPVRPWFGDGSGVALESYRQAADELLAGRLRVFGLALQMGATPQWNRDPKTGTVAPLQFGKTLNYRDESLVGDIKYLWEPNRHLHLVTLAQAYRLSGDKRFLEGLRHQIDSWLAQCPYPLGPNWSSSLELGIRLINWSIVWQLIGGIDSPMFAAEGGASLRDRWLRSIFQHMHFIRGHFSRHSSANNHLIGEASGLFVGAVSWPYWQQCQRWADDAKTVLEDETRRQNGPDGVNREQAVSYQQFVLDFLLIPALLGRANRHEFSPEYWKRIEAMLEYLASIMDVRGHVPMIGDADDGYAVRLSMEPDFCPYRSLLATGAVLFKRGDFKAKAGALDDKTRWLLGSAAEQDYNAIAVDTTRLPVRRAFPDGGYYILGCDFETDREIRAIVDAGPLGYLSIAAHGHADALGLTLAVGGREFLIDPGTYAYHTQKQWRDYFRGTAAHNTVVVDGENQSMIGGNFMWLHHAQVRCELWKSDDTEDRFVGVHSGYNRLPDPVTHRRAIVFDKVGRVFDIGDELLCKGEHTVERYWHFAESCEVAGQPDGSVVARSGVWTIRMAPIGFGVETIVRGGTTGPIGGWVSRSFDVKTPSTTVVWRNHIQGSTTLRTRIELVA